MRNLILTAVLALGMMALTTGCTSHADGAAKKCGASGKCNQGKCGDAKGAKKCGDAKGAKKCGDAKEATKSGAYN